MSDRPGQSEQQLQARTQTDAVRPSLWLGEEPILQLREWASDRTHRIPDVPEPIIGADPSVDLPLVDPTRSVSRRHGRLVREDGHWAIEDLRSRNGISCDGAHRPGRWFVLVPGMEIGLGRVTLVAENATLIRLRAYLARLLGWDTKAYLAIDLAMRAIRAAANRRAPLVLAGSDDLVAVARQIHLRTLPASAGFVMCGRGKRESDASVRVTATTSDPFEALHRAAGGTVCVRSDQLPINYDALVEATSDRYAAAQLFICARRASKRPDPVAPPIVVPSLAHRPVDDIHRIVSEYAADAASELGVGQDAFTPEQHAWAVRHATSSFADVEIATLRIIARNAFGSVRQAASRLGVSHVALGKWFKHRKLAV